MKPEETVDYHIKLNWYSIINIYNKIAQKHGLTQASGFALLNISSKGTPATKIAPLMGMKATSLSRLLKKMEDDQLICRKKEKKDRRMVMIHLTDLGKEKKAISKKVVVEFNKYMITHIDQADLEVYYKVMETLFEANKTYLNTIGDE